MTYNVLWDIKHCCTYTCQPTVWYVFFLLLYYIYTVTFGVETQTVITETCYQWKRLLCVSVGYFKENILLHFIASMISGLITTAASMPVDIAKTRFTSASIVTNWLRWVVPSMAVFEEIVTVTRRVEFWESELLWGFDLEYVPNSWMSCSVKITRGQSNLTKSASRGAHSPVKGHPRGSKVVPLNSWGRVSY